MKAKKFQKYLDCYGTDLKQWPISLQKQARSALAESSELQSLLTEAQSLENLLRSDATSAPVRDWIDQIVSQARRTPQNQNQSRTIEFLSQWLQKLKQPIPALALMGCLIAGILTGFLTSDQVDTSNPGTEWASLLYDEEVLLWDESSN